MSAPQVICSACKRPYSSFAHDCNPESTDTDLLNNLQRIMDIGAGHMLFRPEYFSKGHSVRAEIKHISNILSKAGPELRSNPFGDGLIANPFHKE